MSGAGQNKNVADIYRLSDLQEAMLIHRLEKIEQDSGVLILRARLRGPLDLERFEEAWNGTIARHPVLRSSLHWRKLKHPVQVVAKVATCRIELSKVTAGAVEEAASKATLELRESGLEITKAPVMAWRLLRVEAKELDAEEHVLLWACHHLLLDGWSSALVLSEVLARHDGRDPGPPPRAYKEWIRWTREAKESPAAGSDQDFWRQSRLEPKRVLLAQALKTSTPTGPAEIRRLEHRPAGTGPDLGAWLRRHGVTLGSAAIACWGLVLSEATGARQCSLGFTSSGRGGDFDGLENMIGMFTSVLPMTFRVDPQASPPKLVRAVLERQAAMQSFPPAPLGRLFESGGVTLLRPPFDTLLTFANFPTTSDSEGGLELADFRGGVTSNFPLTLALLPGGSAAAEPVVEARYDARFDEREVRALVERFCALLAMLPEEPETLRDLMDRAKPALAAFATKKMTDIGKKPSPSLRPLGGTGSEGPGSATEAQLMRIWNDLIAVQEYGVDDNFFELGGHSLLVPQMLLRIEQDFGVSLPLGVVFEQASLRAIAAAIDRSRAKEDDDDAPAWRPLVAIRPAAKTPESPGGGESPLFMVHGLGGEVGWFYNLANFLDESVPLYGLQAPPEPFENLEEMAARYLEEVRRVQPQGPYRLGGYCIGGGVAYEMARQLREITKADAPEDVSMLVLIDSVPQAHIVDQQASTPLGSRVKRLLSKDPREIVRSTRDFAVQTTRRLRSRLESEGGSGPLELDDVLDMTTLPQVYHEPSRRHFRAMRDYEPGPYGGDVWLLRTADQRFGEDFGWGGLVRGELQVERVPGRHIDVLKEPHVQVVGAKLTRALDLSRKKTGAAGV